MCTRFSLVFNQLLEIQEQFNTHNVLDGMDFKKMYLPTDRILVIYRNEELGKNEMIKMRWGLIPNFIKDFDQIKKYSLYNARSESLEEKQSFKSLLNRNRCLIPVDLFYEYKTDGEVKEQYAFSLNPESRFAVAGLWDLWTNPKTKEKIYSCTMITTIGNEIVAPIHEKNRMPVILERDLYDKWLDPNIDFSVLKDLIVPYNASKMKAVKNTDKDNLPLNPRIKISNQEKEELNQPSLFSSK
ncbi:MAG TPA: SOS response-associated peptidase [Leptospiraceae bacterium]|nr:SOS response-associated peptidase [Leptospiraceae bacterium]HMW06458.1 SOS response-associated peptidase [Leptospiraceae bacterium]HMX32440.1 SOS response-associated peptidase [Leptospiraceae bacterium]HMY33683.1 SOS response-associated peptidase [Leptospiraceae bacterium]HMZ65234.1 SOS response-associated peptidase [Leptospiraceae bacterium]